MGSEELVSALPLDASTKTLLVQALVALLVAVAIARWFLSRPKYPHSLPPSLGGVPVIGGLLKFMKGPLPLVTEAYKKLGSVFTVNVLHMKITFLIGPEVSAHFFKAPEEQLSQQEVYKYNVPTFGPGVVFDVPYSIRMEQFRFFADALRVSKMKTYVDMMVQEAQEFFGQWGDEGEVDFKEEMARLIILTASRCLLGREVRERMVDRVSWLFHELDAGMLPISVVFPYLPIPPHARRDRARKELSEIFTTIIQERKKSGKKEDDMLQVFIDSEYKLLNRPTTEEECAGLLTAALFAGQHTSSLTATWIAAYLSKHKADFLPPVLEEQKKVVAECGTGLNAESLGKMDHLQRVMKEVLRLHPPLIMLLRYVHDDFNVKTREGNEFTVPKGNIVAACPVYSNRLPHIFKNPDSFDPDRYAPGREEDKTLPFSLTSFGGGRHGCMGETFAYMQVKTIWSIVMREFDIELISPFPQPDWDSLVVGPKGKLMCRYKRLKLLQS